MELDLRLFSYPVLVRGTTACPGRLRIIHQALPATHFGQLGAKKGNIHGTLKYGDTMTHL